MKLFSQDFRQIVYLEFYENIRNKWVFLYAIAFFMICSLTIYFGGKQSSKITASLLNIFLLLIPIFGLLFGSVNFMESLPFMEVILSRPVSRAKLFLGKWIGANLGLNLGFVSGTAIPLILFMDPSEGKIFLSIQLLIYGVLLNSIFLSLSFLASIIIIKKEMVLGSILIIWFYFYFLYDLLIVGISIFFGEYPLEVPVLGMVLLNPLDLVRVIILLQMDSAVLLGFTSAFFQKYLGNVSGIFLCFVFLSVWIITPIFIGVRIFKSKDL
ncbi:MAG: ABC transporter permease [Leptospiraceae bacterium]|nr:ABC transporter permease subunit [Leptospiraceae bacterium]MCK6382581.1 ABC transporter permease [Leptospiraceae bacterium]